MSAEADLSPLPTTEFYKFVHCERQCRAFYDFIAASPQSLDDPTSLTLLTLSAAPSSSRVVSFQFISRRKYNPLQQRGTVVFDSGTRLIRDSNHFVHEIKKRELPVGAHRDWKVDGPDDQVLNPGSCGCYCVPNSSNSVKACQAVMTEMRQLQNQIVEAVVQNKSSLKNLQQTLQGYCEHFPAKFHSKSMSTVNYDFIHLDIDTKEPVKLGVVIEFLQVCLSYNCDNCIGGSVPPASSDLSVPTMLMETRNGFHVLVDARGAPKLKQKAFLAFKGNEWTSVCPAGSPCPVPGTVVGGFEVHLIENCVEWIMSLARYL